MQDSDQLKVCLLGATFSTGNMGVSALTAGIIKCIIAECAHAEIVLLDYGKEPAHYNLSIDEKTVTVSLLNMRFSKKVYLKNNIIILFLIALTAKLLPFKRVRSKIIAGNQYLSTINNSDIIGAISGGDSFSDIYGLGRFFYVSLPQLLVLTVKKNLLLLPQTLGPFEGKISRCIAKKILHRAKTIYSRDYAGLAEMKSFLGVDWRSEKVKFCYDVGFVIDPIKPDKMEVDNFFANRRKNTVSIGFNISGLLYMGGYSRNNMFGLNLDYRELVVEIIDLLCSKKESRVLLIPHVFGSSQHSENDSVVCAKVCDSLKAKYQNKLFAVRGRYDQNEIKYIIGQGDFFIGSRMHACIAAFSQNIPAVAIAYSKKFFGVIQTIGMESFVADPRKTSKEQILELIDQSYEQRMMLKEKLETKIPAVRSDVLEEFKNMILSSRNSVGLCE